MILYTKNFEISVLELFSKILYEDDRVILSEIYLKTLDSVVFKKENIHKVEDFSNFTVFANFCLFVKSI